MEYAKQRVVFDRPIGQNQGIAFPLAEAHAKLRAAALMVGEAGRLIDAAGLKGYRIGTAQVSTLHANFIVLDHGGSAADVRSLGDHVRSVVADTHGVELQYEIEFVGEWGREVAGA